MAGVDVTRAVMDVRLGEAALAVRGAFEKVDNIFYFLQNNPAAGDPVVDPLCVDFGYTTDEAYLIRLVFESLKTLKTDNPNLETNLRKLTGLE